MHESKALSSLKLPQIVQEPSENTNE